MNNSSFLGLYPDDILILLILYLLYIENSDDTLLFLVLFLLLFNA